MSNERYDDELLSAIIDGEAEPELVAAVNADTEASTRLERMQQAVQVVSEEPAAATPERRSASIAAAMAAATPAPEVTSLAAARHERAETEKKARSFSGGWVAAVAAAVAFLIAIPIAIGLGGGSDTADVAADAADTTSLAVPEDGADAAGDAADAAEDNSSDDSGFDDATSDDSAMEDEGDAMEESMEDQDAMEEEVTTTESTRVFSGEDETTDAVAGDEPLAVSPSTTTIAANDRARNLDDLKNLRNLATANNVDGLNDVVRLGRATPRFSAADIATVDEVSAACVQPSPEVTSATPYDLVTLTPFGGEDRLILVEFADDGSTRLLEAEDCAPLR